MGKLPWVFLLLVGLVGAGGARADIDLVDMWDNATVPASGIVFPNWLKVKVCSFDVWICEGCGAGAENIVGLTLVNFGTAAKADFAGVYWKARCGATDSGLYTMTWAGTYSENSGSYPAWTWAGTSIDVSGCADLCGTPACGAFFTIDVYVDIAPCPTDLSSVRMGFPVKSPGTYWGSITDNYGTKVPWVDTSGGERTIVYALKEGDRDTAAPGDAITYTITYGRPGTNPIQSFVVIDSQPPYTHYLAGSASPAPDSGWDPLPGSPMKLRWTVAGPFATTGGPTDDITFQLTVDWGNGDSFESGSGDVAAPEGKRLYNSATVFFNKAVQDCRDLAVTMPPTIVVRRFLFWKLGDNDVLFSPTYGQSPDEMIYSIFMKNVSSQKTWWDVRIWDSVPSQLTPWDADCGFEDPCTGWTMTPSGCAPASPGRYLSGTTTVLTWKLDMPPEMTLVLRWKAKVRPNTMDGTTAINTVSLLEYGHSRIVGGTGYSGQVANFAHLAPIILPTTYISYVAFAASGIHAYKGECPGFLVDFFPLNRKTQFELRGLQYTGAGWATTGGVSASIGTLIGDCIGGFPGGAGVSGGGTAGCKSERVPAVYEPTDWLGTCPTWPANFIYKLTSNSPVLWQLLTHIEAVESGGRDDNHTPAPATTLNYVGLMHYMYKRYRAGCGDCLGLVNTGVNPYGTFDSDLATTVHLFKWDGTGLAWEHQRTYEIGPESQAFDIGTPLADEGPWRTVSSVGRLIVDHAMNILTTTCNSAVTPTACGNNFATYMPARESGNVTQVAPGNFYGYVGWRAYNAEVVIGNTGATDAKVRVWRYYPDNTIATAPMVAWLNGTSGTWVMASAIVTVQAGIAAANNPRVYDLEGTFFNSSTTGLYKVELVSGGPIQVLHGGQLYIDNSGGSVMHSADGYQSGYEFWLHHAYLTLGGSCDPAVQTINVYCPKQGTGIRCVSNDGYSATYTTSGPDQCVSFVKLSDLAAEGNTRNYRVNVIGSTSRVTVQHIICLNTQKGYTAPFLQTGTHYNIIMPPVVYLGQNFWITVIVVESGGTTMTNYAGTTSFTSTDPGAKIQGAAMEGYNYTWNGCGTNCGVKVFVNVSFSVLGVQTIIAIDTYDGSISGVASTLVVAADVKLEKRRKLTVAASGDTVQFQICWSNYSTSTAYSFTITDAVPMGTSYVPEVASSMLCGSSAPVPGVIVYYSTATTTTPPGTFTSVPGTGSPLSNSRWLRWTIRDVYVNSSGCVCYRVSVN